MNTPAPVPDPEEGTPWVIFEAYDEEGRSCGYDDDGARLEQVATISSKYAWSPPDAQQIGEVVERSGNFVAVSVEKMTRVPILSRVEYYEAEEEETDGSDS